MISSSTIGWTENPENLPGTAMGRSDEALCPWLPMAKRLTQFLEVDESIGAAKVMSHAHQLLAIARVYRDIAPRHLADGSRVANFKSGVVVIHAANGAVASKLRQMPNSLLEKFLEHGVPCTGIQIKIKGSQELPSTPRQPLLKPLAARTCDQLTALSDSLPPSPLRTALATLVERAAKKE